MVWLRKLYDKLHLQINEGKSTVGSVFGRKFLGYGLWRNHRGEVKRAVADKALVKFKQRVRQQTRRTAGCSLAEVISAVRSYLLGWKGYFRYSHNLNFPNRPVRTRMQGGVAGGRSTMLIAPMPIL